MEDAPTYVNDATSLQQYADYYAQYPERRHLYYLDAATGEDMWDGDSTSYVPVVVPYWGMLNPVIDPQGNAWIPINSGGGTRNIDLYKVDLSNGHYTKVAEREDFFERGDETGRFTFADGVYFSTVLSTVGKYDPQSNRETKIFGPSPGAPPFECANLDPMPVDCAYVDRMAGTTGFGGVHRASALVVANGTGFLVTHGWLYALTPENVSVIHHVDLEEDFTAGAPKRDVTYDALVAELNQRVEQMISYGHLEPFPYFWNWGKEAGNLPPSLWQQGEVIRSLAHTMPYLTEENQGDLKAYLRDEVLNYLLDAGQYGYKQQCQIYSSYEVVDCDSGMYEETLKTQWYANNENYTAERVYAFYAYAKHTDDWQLIRDHWDFIVSRYNAVAERFDSELGHVVTRQWLSGPNLDLQTQAACFYAMKEMAAQVGDDNLANQAEDYYDQVIQARIYYGNEFLRQLYDDGALTPTTPEEVGEQKIIYPPEGIINRETDVRQIGWRSSSRTELRVSGVSSAIINLAPGVYEALVGDYDYPVQFLQMYPEVGEALSSSLQESTQKYIDAIANYNPWWYWGDSGHCPHKADENLYSKPFMATALFQAKAYILKEPFSTLKDTLPWPVARAGFRDMYRLQNLVALLQAEGAYPGPSKRAWPIAADAGQSLTYTVTLMGTGDPITVTDVLPDGLQYIDGSTHPEPDTGSLEINPPHIRWYGTLPMDTSFTLSYGAMVVTTTRRAVLNSATVEGLGTTPLHLSAAVVVNGCRAYMPLILQDWY